MGNVKFIEHKRMEILRIDLSPCELEEIVPILNNAKKTDCGEASKVHPYIDKRNRRAVYSGSR